MMVFPRISGTSDVTENSQRATTISFLKLGFLHALTVVGSLDGCIGNISRLVPEPAGHLIGTFDCYLIVIVATYVLIVSLVNKYVPNISYLDAYFPKRRFSTCGAGKETVCALGGKPGGGFFDPGICSNTRASSVRHSASNSFRASSAANPPNVMALMRDFIFGAICGT